jgi:hypothetical protein
MNIKQVTVTKQQYIIMGLTLFLYILMLTKLFFTLSIDSRSLIDLIIISTPQKVEQAINLLPTSDTMPHYIQFLLDSLFVSMFYPLLISLFDSSFILCATISLSGIGDIIENGISCYFLEQRIPDASILQFASIVTNAKFLFLLLSIVIIVVKLLRKTS